MLQPISALSTRSFLARSRFSSPPSPLPGSLWVRTRVRDHCTDRNPAEQRAAGQGYTPVPPQTTASGDPQVLQDMGEKKSTDTAGDSSWHSLASSSKAGAPEPSPNPHAGQAHSRSESSNSAPGSVPSWPGRDYFLLKKEKIRTKKDIQGAKPFPPTHK